MKNLLMCAMCAMCGCAQDKPTAESHGDAPLAGMASMVATDPLESLVEGSEEGAEAPAVPTDPTELPPESEVAAAEPEAAAAEPAGAPPEPTVDVTATEMMAADATTATEQVIAPATPPTLRYLAGVYFVPDRSAVSTYPVQDVRWLVDGDQATLEYHLPRMLVGRSVHLHFSGTVSGQRAELSGPFGTASCTVDDSGAPVSCLERFVGLEVDLERVRKEAQAADPSQLAARVEVSTRFQNDPIGVFESEDTLLGPAPLEECSTGADCLSGRCEIEHGAGYCEPEGQELAVGSACRLSLDCAAGLECEEEHGQSICAAAEQD